MAEERRAHWTDGLAPVLLAFALLVAAYVAWRLSTVLLMMFAAALVGVSLRRIARAAAQFTGLPERAGVLLSLLVLAGAAAAAGWLFGAQIGGQLDQLVQRLPGALALLEERLGVEIPIANLAQEHLTTISGLLFGQVAAFGSALAGTLTGAFLVVIAGAYIAWDPHTYRDGALRLVPARHRARARDFLDTVGRAWAAWLLGQAISMALVGMLVGLGAWAIGLPSPVALGLIAGLLEFVPLAGAWLGAVPALLVAGAESWSALAWTAALFLAIQQIESYLIVPLLQQRLVSLAPALVLFAVISGGVLFGALGVVLAVPIAILVQIAVTKLYVREVLGEEAQAPGENPDDHHQMRAEASSAMPARR
jgi:predicted PurR-regulated permease PerM